MRRTSWRNIAAAGPSPILGALLLAPVAAAQANNRSARGVV